MTAVLTSAAITGHAFTLGDLRGSAVIGRSLDLSVPVVADMGEEVLASCMSAEVFFGDLRQLTTSIALTPVNSGLVSMTMLRIKSSSLVNEPVVTVVLRSTCDSTTTRRYVLLTNFPTPDLPHVEIASVTERLLPPAFASGSIAASQTAAGVEAPASRRTAHHHTTRTGPVTPRPTTSAQNGPKRPLPPMRAETESELSRPVLKLDESLVLPVLAETPHPVELSAPAPSENPLKLAVRIEALQSDIKVLTDLAQKNEVRLTEFQSKLHQAESERVPWTWVYLLAGLLMTTLATLTWVLSRQQGSSKNGPAEWTSQTASYQGLPWT
ncbi:hypothetical protein [Rhodoferax sp.]|uniref:hypothetical protein n=1 Tax=Rhodoferax sp. TaxID=50421 RepID=UPI00284AF007|nr:hypothetical protein [Rhodoferax sp.]MDR3369082.1 hypothetical protein [Rhodoferax sp.]